MSIEDSQWLDLQRSSIQATPAPSRRALAHVEGARSAAAPAAWRAGGTSLVIVIPVADGNSAAGRATLDRIRATALPGEVTIGGEAALSADFVDAV